MALVATLWALLAASQAPAAPLTQPADRLTWLSRRGIELLKQKKYEDAEKTFDEALRISPNRYLNLYNMACAKARLGRTQDALGYLERATSEGFTDFIHIQKDEDLASLRRLPRYEALMGRKDELQRQDAQRIVAFLKHELGQGYLFEIDTEHKLIFATNTDAPTLAELKRRLVMQATSLWEQVFENRPDQYISMVLPSAVDYRQIVSRPGVGGFYDHENRRLIAQRLGQVMQHEFTHALHNSDLDWLEQEHAAWVQEGLATLFESGRFEGQRLSPAESYRLGAVQEAARKGRLIPFTRLFAMDPKAFTANAVVNLTYGQAGSLMLYLHEQGLLRKFYETYKQGYAAEKTGRAALERVTGRKLAEVEREWKEWMMGRTPPPLDTGPQGAILGARFGEANDGLRIDYLLPLGPAQRAGLKAGDIVVGVDGEDVRDANSLMPLLSEHAPGDRVTVKVRRGEAYVSVVVRLGRRDAVEGRPASRQ